MWEAFSAHLSNILPEPAAEILNSMDQPQFPSIRFNRAKPAVVDHTGTPVPWEARALQLDTQPAFIRDPYWHAGAYYVQESSSMYLGQLLRQALHTADGAKPLLALDLCAAPGGKSTHLLDVLPDNALLVSNELLPKRNAILRENLIRWGRPNIIITQNEPAHFRPYAELFDLVVVDAPCSGEGLFRRDKTAIQEWRAEAVQHCALRQQDILDEATRLVKMNGLLLYSTCTFEPSENEAQVERLLQQGFELIPAEKLFPEPTEGLLPGTLRFYPHKTSGSGFFIACLRKVKETAAPTSTAAPNTKQRVFPISPSGWKDAAQWITQPENHSILQTPYAVHAFPKAWCDELLYFNQHLHIKYFGCELGELKQELFIPAHALALSTLIRPEIPALETDRENALTYLRKESQALPDLADKQPGWRLIRYKGLNLGWIKVLPGRINNYLPANWRILH